MRETPKTLCARKALHPRYAFAAFPAWTSKRFSPVAVYPTENILSWGHLAFRVCTPKRCSPVPMHLTENNIYTESPKKIALLWYLGQVPQTLNFYS